MTPIRCLAVWVLVSIAPVCLGAWQQPTPPPLPPTPEKVKVLPWPGAYECEQCKEKRPTKVNESRNAASGNDVPGYGCWTYEIEIDKNASGQFNGTIDIYGPDEDRTINSNLNLKGNSMEFHFSESSPAKEDSADPTYNKDELLVVLQRREGDFLLRFKGLKSKWPDQSVITCKRSAN